MRTEVELVYFAGCHYVEEAREELRRAFAAVGLPAAWTEWDTLEPGCPGTAHGYASPTVLVGGQDVLGTARGDGEGCALNGPPPAAAIAAALRRALPDH